VPWCGTSCGRRRITVPPISSGTGLWPVNPEALLRDSRAGFGSCWQSCRRLCLCWPTLAGRSCSGASESDRAGQTADWSTADSLGALLAGCYHALAAINCCSSAPSSGCCAGIWCFRAVGRGTDMGTTVLLGAGVLLLLTATPPSSHGRSRRGWGNSNARSGTMIAVELTANISPAMVFRVPYLPVSTSLPEGRTRHATPFSSPE